MLSFNIKKNLLGSNGYFQLNCKLDTNDRSIIAFVGESGSGKTTLLRILSGLTKPDNGFIKYDNEIWYDNKNKINIPTRKREIGFLFQDFALFPHMTVYENIRYACKDRKKIDYCMRLTNMESLKSVYPHKLSGGQKQRVALIRALVRQPKLLLMDEPFSALDRKMSLKLIELIRNLKEIFECTIIFVSHRPEDISLLADRCFYLDDGFLIESSFSKEPKTILRVSKINHPKNCRMKIQ
jgi:molybdate transport system ATP-binding protein